MSLATHQARAGVRHPPHAPGAGLAARDAVALACFFISGFLALVYQICWIRKGSLVFGAATPALSTVLAVFFGGMALGSYLFGRYAQRTARPLVVYAVLEIALGLFVVASPLLFQAADGMFGWVYPILGEGSQSAWHGAQLSATRAMLLIGLLLVPSTLMGGTLPLFCRHYVIRADRISTSVGLLYGCNTLGAAVGCAVSGFLLIPALGVNASLVGGGLLNILVGLLVWRVFSSRATLPAGGKQRPSQLNPSAVGQARSRTENREPGISFQKRRADLWLVSGLFFGSGLIVLANEVLWVRFLSLLVRNTVHTYTLTLTVILGGIVAGSVLTAWLFDRTSRRALVFGAVQVLMGLTVLAVLTLPAAWWHGLLQARGAAGQGWVFLLVLFPPAVLAGISFPLAIRMAVHSPALSGIGVGRMTAINTLGGIVGALGAGFFILPLLGLYSGVLLVTGLSVVLGMAAWGLLERSVAWWARGGLIVLSGGAWMAAAGMTDTRLPADFLADRDRLVAYREGTGSNLAIVRRGETLALEIDRLWQGEDRRRHQIMAAHVPALLHPDPRHVLVIGTGTGQTAGRFLMHGIERLDCVDIEEALIPLVREHFESAWMDDPRVRFIVEDGRSFTAHTDARYDLISIEVGQVFRPGVAGFYTLDFYRQARGRLRPGGLLCQFVPVSFFDPEEFRMVIRTFQEVFPECVLWYNTGELLLIGTNADRIVLSQERLARISQDPTLRADLEFAYWGGPAEWLNRPEVFLAGFLCGPEGIKRLSAGAPIYRDDRPHLEYQASQERTTSEIAIVERLLEACDPVSRIMDGLPDGATLATLTSLRQRNLMDIVADAMKRPVEDLLARGRSAEAINQLRRALAWNEKNVEINLLLAGELISQGDFAAALPHVTTAVRVDPENSRAHYGMGHALHQLGRVDEAIVHYAESLRLEPDNAETHNNLGTALAARQEYELAHEHLRRAVELAPAHAAAHNNLANVLTVLGRAEEAIDSYRAALRLRPDYIEAHLNQGIVLLRLGRLEEAVESFHSVLALRPDLPAARLRLGDALAAAGRFEHAMSEYRRILQVDPGHAEARARLAEIAHRAK